MVDLAPEKIRYPYFNKPLIVEQLRKSLWKIRNRSENPHGTALRFHVSPDESYGLCEKFIFDGFSIPLLARWLVPKDQPGLICAAFHDSWCEKHYIPSKKAHELFALSLDAWTLVSEGVDPVFEKTFDFLRRDKWLIAKAVSLGGPRWSQLKPRPLWA